MTVDRPRPLTDRERLLIDLYTLARGIVGQPVTSEALNGMSDILVRSGWSAMQTLVKNGLAKHANVKGDGVYELTERGWMVALNLIDRHELEILV